MRSGDKRARKEGRVAQGHRDLKVGLSQKPSWRWYLGKRAELETQVHQEIVTTKGILVELVWKVSRAIRDIKEILDYGNGALRDCPAYQVIRVFQVSLVPLVLKEHQVCLVLMQVKLYDINSNITLIEI